jgi:hypothetical protein
MICYRAESRRRYFLRSPLLAAATGTKTDRADGNVLRGPYPAFLKLFKGENFGKMLVKLR